MDLAAIHGTTPARDSVCWRSKAALNLQVEWIRPEFITTLVERTVALQGLSVNGVRPGRNRRRLEASNSAQ